MGPNIEPCGTPYKMVFICDIAYDNFFHLSIIIVTHAKQLEM